MASRGSMAWAVARAALGAAAGVVLVAITVFAVALSPRAGVIGITAVAVLYGLVWMADRDLPRHRRMRRLPAWSRRIVPAALVAGTASLLVLNLLPSDAGDPGDPPGEGGVPLVERAVVPATYRGTADHDGDCMCWRVVDTLAIPAATFNDTVSRVRSTAVTPDALHDAVVAEAIGDGWEPTLLNGALALTRERQVSFPSGGAGLGRLLAAHRLPIILPTTGLGDLVVLVRFDGGSQLHLTAPDKAVSATDPAFGGRDLLAQGREQVEVPIVDGRAGDSGLPRDSSADIAIDVLSPWARVGAIGPALARMQTGGLASIVVVGILGIVGVTGRRPLLPLLRSAIGRLRAWWASRREGRPADAVRDDHGYL